jgi:hypothetical protein
MIALQTAPARNPGKDPFDNPIFKEKLMPEPRTCHLPTNTALFCTRVQRLDQAKALQRHCPDIVVSTRTELGGRR